MEQKKVWTNAKLVGQRTEEDRLVDIAVVGEKIVEVAPAGTLKDVNSIDCEGRLLTPSFIDCHTHLIYGGDRTKEFEMRLEGATYEEISRAGGGIVSSVKATRRLSVDGLVAASLPRINALLSEGCATLEIKSGYGLTIESELNMLRAARKIADEYPVRVTTTWLAAHALPPDFSGTKAQYIQDVAIAGLEAAHQEGLVDAVDAFCESIAFSVEEIEPLFKRAQALGIPVKLHSEQLTRSGGSLLSARYNALSVDHFEYAEQEEIDAIRGSGTVAVMLPGAFYMLRETQKPPIELLRKAGVPMALATDANPGTSPITSMLLTMNLAAVLFGLTVRECLDGVTCHAAQALGLQHEIGRVAAGYSADFSIWDVEHSAQLVGRAGINPIHSRVFKGSIING